MRRINKGLSERNLERKNKNKPISSDQATLAWGRFRGKSATRVRCFNEQFGLCGYSEVELSDFTPITDINGFPVNRDLGFHLEHIEPKSVNPLRTFDHDNIIASAIDDIKSNQLDASDVFGGHAKLKWYNADAFIHCLMDECDKYFHYETTGKVVPKENLPTLREKAKARLTIYKLNLNAPVLILWRKTWLEALDQMILSINNVEGLKKLAEVELLPIGNRLRPFHSAQRQLLGRIGDEVCNLHIPKI